MKSKKNLFNLFRSGLRIGDGVYLTPKNKLEFNPYIDSDNKPTQALRDFVRANLADYNDGEEFIDAAGLSGFNHTPKIMDKLSTSLKYKYLGEHFNYGAVSFVSQTNSLSRGISKMMTIPLVNSHNHSTSPIFIDAEMVDHRTGYANGIGVVSLSLLVSINDDGEIMSEDGDIIYVMTSTLYSFAHMAFDLNGEMFYSYNADAIEKAVIQSLRNGLAAERDSETKQLKLSYNSLSEHKTFTVSEFLSKMNRSLPKLIPNISKSVNDIVQDIVKSYFDIQVVIIDGSDIDEIYNEYTLYRDDENESNELNSSCMNSKGISMEVYCDCKMAVVVAEAKDVVDYQEKYDSDGLSALEGKMIGRAILWSGENGDLSHKVHESGDNYRYGLEKSPENFIACDRIYAKTNHQVAVANILKDMFGNDNICFPYYSEDWAGARGTQYIRSLSYTVDSPDDMPYLDTFHYGEEWGDGIKLTTYQNDYIFDTVNGHNPVNSVWSNYHDDFIPVDLAVKCNGGSGWIYEEEATYVDGDYYHESLVHMTEDTSDYVVVDEYGDVTAYDSYEEPIYFEYGWYAEYEECPQSQDVTPLSYMEEASDGKMVNRDYLEDYEDSISEDKD